MSIMAFQNYFRIQARAATIWRASGHLSRGKRNMANCALGGKAPIQKWHTSLFFGQTESYVYVLSQGGWGILIPLNTGEEREKYLVGSTTTLWNKQWSFQTAVSLQWERGFQLYGQQKLNVSEVELCREMGVCKSPLVSFSCSSILGLHLYFG